LQIILHADGQKRSKPLLIFHGKGDRFGRPIDNGLKAETKKYNPQVVVVWNPKAYANTKVMLEWIKRQYVYASDFPFAYKDVRRKMRVFSLLLWERSVSRK
jgi:hypothetical protein